MADVSGLYTVVLGQTSAPADHNTVVQAIQNVNAELGDFFLPLARYTESSDQQDTLWSGTKTQCYRDADTGYLYPNATDLWTGSDTWTGLDTWDPGWVSSYQYLTNAIDMGAAFRVSGTFTVAGNFSLNPALQAQYSLNGVDWTVWPSSQAGLSLTLSPVVARYFRFQWTVTQTGTAPRYTSGFSYDLVGPQITEEDSVDVPVAGLVVTYQRAYPQAPGVIAAPHYQAAQDVRLRVSELTDTGCRFDLVMADSPATPINGRISYRTVLPQP